jgi:lipoprotein-releasing system permease protein
LLAGKVIQFNDSLKKHICISKTTADRLNLKTGDKMNIYFLGAHLSARAFIVSGIYETGLDEFDRSFAITDIATIRKLNGWSANDCHGIELMVKDMNLLPQTTNTIHRKLPLEMAARSMKELYPQIFEWLSLVDTNVYIIIIIMMLIALITMITTVIVLIIERTQMIGTLKSVGANNKLITQIFLRMAARLIAVGLFWGNLIALSFCWIQKEYHLIKLDQQSYYMKYVPIHFDMAWILGINAGTFVVCIFFLLLPSLIIARISPMTAIRFN